MKSKEEILNFFDNEAALGFCTNEYALRLKWYFATYYNEYAQQPQPSGMRWVDDVNKIRGQAKAFGDKYSGSISEQAAAEVGFNAAINQVINILSESSPAGAAEGIKCKCPDNIKHGQTSVMCCNHCGLPDEDFYDNRG